LAAIGRWPANLGIGGGAGLARTWSLRQSRQNATWTYDFRLGRLDRVQCDPGLKPGLATRTGFVSECGGPCQRPDASFDLERVAAPSTRFMRNCRPFARSVENDHRHNFRRPPFSRAPRGERSYNKLDNSCGSLVFHSDATSKVGSLGPKRWQQTWFRGMMLDSLMFFTKIPSLRIGRRGLDTY
jgi:hypothetical protein